MLLCVIAGCAAPDRFLRRVDEQRVTIGRGLVDVIDAADRSFGESRVEDAERIVQAKVGPEVIVRENETLSVRFPIRLRAPLPALQRWANVFLQFDTITDAFDTFGEFGGGLDDNKAFTLSWLSKIGERLDTGVKGRLRWDSGPQVNLRPFVRWEHRSDGWRVGAEQSLYWDTRDDIGGRTLVEGDRRLGAEAFGRLLVLADYHGELEGIDYQAALVYRRAFVLDSFVSAELQVSFNPHDGPTEEGQPPDPSIPLAEQDDDEVSVRLAMTGNAWRPWIEYELGPGVHFPWRHDDKMEFSFRLMLRLVYEDYLRRRQPGEPRE